MNATATPNAPARAGVPPSELMAKLTSLPPFNSTAVKLLAIASDSDVDFRQIEESVRRDPSLTGQLLVLANSALFGHRSEIATVRQALTTVGLNMFRQLIATVATSSYMNALPSDWVKPLWMHAVATAVIAEHLAKHSDVASSSLMYTAGLTHDLGRLGMLTSERQAYREFMSGKHVDFAEGERREQEMFGMTHTQAGFFLMRAWGFPEALCGHARSHHDPAAEGTRIMQNACLLADHIGYPELSLQTLCVPAANLDDAQRELLVQKIEGLLDAGAGAPRR